MNKQLSFLCLGEMCCFLWVKYGFVICLLSIHLFLPFFFHSFSVSVDNTFAFTPARFARPALPFSLSFSLSLSLFLSLSLPFPHPPLLSLSLSHRPLFLSHSLSSSLAIKTSLSSTFSLLSLQRKQMQGGLSVHFLFLFSSFLLMEGNILTLHYWQWQTLSQVILQGEAYASSCRPSSG